MLLKTQPICVTLVYCHFLYNVLVLFKIVHFPHNSLWAVRVWSMKARLSENPLQLSEPKLDVYGLMRVERVKCSCGNVSGRAIPSIKLSEESSGRTTGLIQHAGDGTHFQHNKDVSLFLKKTLYFSIFLTHLLCQRPSCHDWGYDIDPCLNDVCILYV